MELNQQEKNIVKKVIEEMSKCGIFRGCYDAKNGNEDFMLGVNTVMEYLAYFVDDEYGESFTNTFIENMQKSVDKHLKL